MQKLTIEDINLTTDQYAAIVALNNAFIACYNAGVDFVFDHSLNKIVAVNLTNASMQYEETMEDEDIENSIEYPAGFKDEIDNVLCEVGGEMYYTDDFDRLMFVPNDND